MGSDNTKPSLEPNRLNYPWHGVEFANCSDGLLPTDPIYRARIAEADARKAEALALSQSTDPFAEL
jgi:hypothetical protein